MTTREERPWGWFEVLADAPDHKVKRICVTPGRRLSLQRHQHRAEHWYVVAGEAVVEVDGRETIVLPGGHAEIPRGAKHRLGNRGTVPVVLIEIQTGDYFGEDDIERFADDYGRA